MFSSSGLENVHYEGPRLPASEKICQSIVQPKKHSKFPGGHRIKWEKEGSFDILGSFEFVPGMLNSYIMAHPPSIVRRKVYEFSGLLPDTIKSELDRRGNIWESLFNNHISGKEDIGLKSTDVRLSTIAVGTANRGGLAKLFIHGNNICRDKTTSLNQVTLYLERIHMQPPTFLKMGPTLIELSLWNVDFVGDEGLVEIVHGCHLLVKLDLFQWPLNRVIFLIH
ncbi:hypothetical protein MTR67_001029 [Solanum verrucosum]|uniref:AIPP2-like SPOC-like domain-containing protein n=1 Tax=Solanum verrucosum TaxID=315347 RepID=A0AAF0T7H8_SOLVR|nr:hypothetical protein MTR67_001029 [Solanum verrucosum]